MPTKVDKTERKKLKVTWVGEPASFGDGQAKKLLFNADDGLQYETYKQSLFPYILIDADLDADTELRITEGKEGQQYPHWRVVQLYDKDGKPLAVAKSERQYGRDEDRTDFRTAILETGANYREKTWTDKDPEVIAYRVWIYSTLGGKPTERTTMPKEAPAVQKPMVIPSNAKELMTWAAKHGKEFNPSWVRKEANISPNALITDEGAVAAYLVIAQKQKWED